MAKKKDGPARGTELGLGAASVSAAALPKQGAASPSDAPDAAQGTETGARPGTIAGARPRTIAARRSLFSRSHAQARYRGDRMAGAARFDLSLWSLVAPYATVFALFILIPVAVAIGLSFTYFNVVQPPRGVGFLNYITLLTQDEIFLKFVLPNTFKYAFIVGPGGYVLGFVLAWLLAQVPKGPRNILALALYAPSMAGPILITVIWRTIFSGNEAGIINSLLMRLELVHSPIQFLLDPAHILNVVIFVALWSSMGIGFLAMLAGILNVDKTLYEAAYIDGVSRRSQEILYITIPAMKPQMLFGAVMAIVNTFNIGWIGTALAGVSPTPGYAAQLIVNHIEDYGFGRYEMGYAAMVSVALLLMVVFFSRVSYILFGSKE